MEKNHGKAEYTGCSKQQVMKHRGMHFLLPPERGIDT